MARKPTGASRSTPRVPRKSRSPSARTVPVTWMPRFVAIDRRVTPAHATRAWRSMSGGWASLRGGNVAAAARGGGGIRGGVDRAKGDKPAATRAAERMEMRGREMTGWLRVTADQVKTKRQLERWVRTGTAFADSL